VKRSGELKRKTRLSPVGKKRRLATGSRGPSLVLPPRTDDVVDAVVGPAAIAFSNAAASLRAVPKVPPIRDEAFLSLVRTKPCLCCGAAPPSDPAHVGPRGVRQKTDDTRCVSACRWCHTFFDDNGYLPLDGPKTPPRGRAPGPVVRRLTLWTRLRVAEAQRELLVEYVREILGRAA
jgi:hypothetical protein